MIDGFTVKSGKEIVEGAGWLPNNNKTETEDKTENDMAHLPTLQIMSLYAAPVLSPLPPTK